MSQSKQINIIQKIYVDNENFAMTLKSIYLSHMCHCFTTMVWCKSSYVVGKVHECGKRSQNLFRRTKMCAGVDGDEVGKADLTLVTVHSLSLLIRL